MSSLLGNLTPQGCNPEGWPPFVMPPPQLSAGAPRPLKALRILGSVPGAKASGCHVSSRRFSWALRGIKWVSATLSTWADFVSTTPCSAMTWHRAKAQDGSLRNRLKFPLLPLAGWVARGLYELSSSPTSPLLVRDPRATEQGSVNLTVPCKRVILTTSRENQECY